MKAIIYTETGVLRAAARRSPVPEPGPGEVRVRVVVSGVNPTDWKSRRGAGDGAALPFPEVTPNQDGAGVVDAVGEGVDRRRRRRAGVDRASPATSGPTGTAQEFIVAARRGSSRCPTAPASTSAPASASRP